MPESVSITTVQEFPVRTVTLVAVAGVEYELALVWDALVSVKAAGWVQTIDESLVTMLVEQGVLLRVQHGTDTQRHDYEAGPHFSAWYTAFAARQALPAALEEGHGQPGEAAADSVYGVQSAHGGEAVGAADRHGTHSDHTGDPCDDSPGVPDVSGAPDGEGAV